VGIIIVILFATSVPGIAYLSFRENRFNQIKKEAMEKGCGSDDIITSMNYPYLKFRVLREILPLCISDESSLKDRVLLEELKPYFEEISNLQGTYSQWYNLGLIYRNLGEYTQAEHAFQKSVERQPVFELGWSALHALHVEEAARQTGRPIEEFLPPGKKHSADYYDSVFKRH
jgi:tetratricopeptide (TPR) repeat protein